MKGCKFDKRRNRTVLSLSIAFAKPEEVRSHERLKCVFRIYGCDERIGSPHKLLLPFDNFGTDSLRGDWLRLSWLRVHGSVLLEVDLLRQQARQQQVARLAEAMDYGLELVGSSPAALFGRGVVGVLFLRGDPVHGAGAQDTGEFETQEAGNGFAAKERREHKESFKTRCERRVRARGLQVFRRRPTLVGRLPSAGEGF